MTTPPRSQRVVAAPSTLPSAIWMPAASTAQLPSCYQGTPLEIVHEMGTEMKPGIGTQDTLDFLLRFLDDERNIHIGLPPELPEAQRSELFVGALLAIGVAREMPKA